MHRLQMQLTLSLSCSSIPSTWGHSTLHTVASGVGQHASVYFGRYYLWIDLKDFEHCLKIRATTNEIARVFPKSWMKTRLFQQHIRCCNSHSFMRNVAHGPRHSISCWGFAICQFRPAPQSVRFTGNQSGGVGRQSAQLGSWSIFGTVYPCCHWFRVQQRVLISVFVAYLCRQLHDSVEVLHPLANYFSFSCCRRAASCFRRLALDYGESVQVLHLVQCVAFAPHRSSHLHHRCCSVETLPCQGVREPKQPLARNRLLRQVPAGPRDVFKSMERRALLRRDNGLRCAGSPL
jgi:hypothetical protein